MVLVSTFHILTFFFSFSASFMVGVMLWSFSFYLLSIWFVDEELYGSYLWPTLGQWTVRSYGSMLKLR